MNIRSVKAVFMTYQRQRERSAEYSLSRLSRQARRHFAADQPSVAMSVAYMPFSARQPPPDILQNLVLRCLACAILYSNLLLAIETILLTSPTKILRSAQSQTAYLRLPTTAGLLFILTAMPTLRTPCSSSHFLARLGTIFGSVGFRMRFVFLVAPANRECTIRGHYVASSLLRQALFLRSAF